MPGYFIFPPPGTATRPPLLATENFAQPIPSPPSNHAPEVEDDQEKQRKLKEQRRRAAVEERRQQRRDKERQEAYLSELAWVRSGGILRDSQGRPDKVRTEQMREEIRLQDEERRILERWDAYETRLRDLNASEGPVSWQDIPWPANDPVSSPSDLTPDAVSTFILATFKVRNYAGSKKIRIRSSLLRWHPDKMAAIVTRVPDEERPAVTESINAVFRTLKQLQDEFKQPS